MTNIFSFGSGFSIPLLVNFFCSTLKRVKKQKNFKSRKWNLSLIRRRRLCAQPPSWRRRRRVSPRLPRLPWRSWPSSLPGWAASRRHLRRRSSWIGQPRSSWTFRNRLSSARRSCRQSCYFQKKSERGECFVWWDHQNSPPKREQKKKKSSKFGDVSRTGHTRTEWITQRILSTEHVVFFFLNERTHEREKNELKNERMNETAFDYSIARSFFRSLFANARENARAKVNRISRRLHPTWKTSSISGFLFHRARAFKRERDARKTREEREQRHHDSPNFDASLGNDVHANGLRNSGLGNREHYVYECVSEYKMARYLCFFCLFGGKLLRCGLIRSFPRRERICLFSRADSFLTSFFCFSFSPSLYFFFAK